MHWRTLMASYDRFSTLYDSAFSAQQAPKIRALTTAMWGSARPTTGAQVIVDLGAGTGLFGRMTGIAAIEVDFSRQMLSSPRRPRAIQALLHQLPFRDASVDVLVSITSLIDFDHVLPEVDECRRVLRPGGRLLVLEFSKVWSPLDPLYRLYTMKLLPAMGKLVANDSASYRYLAESIAKHPDQDTLKQLMVDAGFERVEYFNLSAGVVALHRGYRL